MEITFNASPDFVGAWTMNIPLDVTNDIDIYNVEAGDFIKLPYENERFIEEYFSWLNVGDYGDYVGCILYYDEEKGENVEMPPYEYDKGKVTFTLFISADNYGKSPHVNMYVDFHDEKLNEYIGDESVIEVTLDDDEKNQLILAAMEALNNKVCGVVKLEKTNGDIIITANTPENKTIHELRDRLDLKTDDEAKYWLFEVLNQNDAKDWIVRQAAAMLDGHNILLTHNE